MDTFRLKKLRTEAGPSKVVYVKGVPPDTLDAELVALAVPFGTCVQTLVIGQKRQAFIEFDSVASASKLMASYPSTAPATIRGAPVYFEYSERTEIKANPRYGGGLGMGGVGGVSGDPTQVSDGKGWKDLPPSRVLLVTVSNMRLPVSVDNLHQVFRPYGEVLRIVTFQKKTFQALIEYSHLVSAINAKRILEGKDIFQGCCSLSLSFSGVTPPLVVKSDPSRARDFTIGSTGSSGGTGLAYPAPLGYDQAGYAGSMPTPDGLGFISTPSLPTPPAFIPGGGGGGGRGQGQEGCVLVVINLPEGKVTPDNLFTLFGVYGDVLRVKILWNKKDTAFIQFATSQQAALARTHLDKVELIDRKISVIVSKNKEITPPPAVPKFQNDTTRDYTDSPLHRFSRPGNRNERHVSAPSTSLHVSNLPDEANPDDLKLFFATGESEESKVVSVKLFGDKKRMAFVNFTSVTDAINALMRYHNAKYGDRNIKISFSHARDGAGL